MDFQITLRNIFKFNREEFKQILEVSVCGKKYSKHRKLKNKKCGRVIFLH